MTDSRSVISETELTTAPGATESRLRFGTIAEEYDRVRPGYPDELIDATLQYGSLGPAARALDVGAGTGQATVQFAGRGLSVLALDPSQEMVSIANDKFADADLDAVAVVGEFETASLDEGCFDLIYAATSWHWLDPDVAFAVAARSIARGGTLAVLSTWPLWRRTALRAQLDAVYAASGAPVAEMGPMCPYEPDPGALAREWVQETNRSGAFGDQVGKLASWSVTYSATGYVDLLGTYGDHIGLEPEVREPLFEGIRGVIDAAGSTIDVQYATLLLLARAR